MSFWGVFGYMGLLMPAAYYLLWGLFCAAGLVGLGMGLARSRPAREGRHPLLPLLFAYGLPALAVILGHVYFNLYDPVAAFQPQGRYLFGALVPILTFLVLGLAGLLRAVGREQWLAPFCAAWALAANFWCLAVISAAPWPRLIWVP
jgi:hypothetical protein